MPKSGEHHEEEHGRPRWDLPEGEEIVPGRTVLRRLGGGHRYEAYLAFDEHLYALVVVKALRPHLTADSDALEGLAHEAEALARLDHPVIARGFGAVVEGSRPHLVLEHLEGPRLSTLIRRYGPLPPEQLVPLALQLCSALHYLAGERIVHLDVKPANTIMGAPPRLIDLSIARTFEEAQALDHPIGTDAYMAPEQCDPARRGPVGPAADVFGLGVTLYRALSGERPFPKPEQEHDGGEPERRWPQLVEAPRPLGGRVPAELADPIMACLAPDPAARPQPAELAVSLESILDALPKPRLGKLRPRWR